MLILQDLSARLEELGVRVKTLSKPPESIDAVLVLDLEGTMHRLAVEVFERAPYPSQVANLDPRKRRLESVGSPVLMTSYVSEGLAVALREAGWSWMDMQGNLEIRVGTVRLKNRVSSGPMPTRQKSISGGTGGLAILRWLISGEIREITEAELAQRAGVTQPRVSQVFSALKEAGLLQYKRGEWIPDRASLLDAFLTEYRGPGGMQWLYYGLESPQDLAVRMCELSSNILLTSADVGPDFLVPWRNPTHLILYTSRPFSWTQLDLVEVESRADANVLVRYPRDRSIFRVGETTATISRNILHLVHPTQMIWDLIDLGGEDREVAAERLGQWVLASR